MPGNHYFLSREAHIRLIMLEKEDFDLLRGLKLIYADVSTSKPPRTTYVTSF